MTILTASKNAQRTELDFARDIEHDILTLKVAVDKVLGVEELEGEQDLMSHVSNVLVAEFVRLSGLVQRATTKVLLDATLQMSEQC